MEISQTTELTRHEAALCFALADPTRIHIIHVLERQPCNVNQLTRELGIPQPMTSRHLRILREHGLVRSARHGVSVTYSLSDPRLLLALALLNDVCSMESEGLPAEEKNAK